MYPKCFIAFHLSPVNVFLFFLKGGGAGGGEWERGGSEKLFCDFICINIYALLVVCLYFK